MKKRIFKIGIFIVVLLSIIVFPLLNRFYFYPKKWKQTFHDLAAAKYKDVSEDRINSYTNCVFEYLDNTYGSANIPESANYTKADIRAIDLCVIDNLLDGDTLKANSRKNIDSIVDGLWKKMHPNEK